MPSRSAKSSTLAQTFHALLNTPLVGEPQQSQHKDVALQDMTGAPSSRRSPSEQSVDSVTSTLDRSRSQESSESSIYKPTS
ncbi:hypothetical protein R3P38DRAFT_3250623 [Favolaschia claudopus]|uniref:Uncharacterized protein n=1 Tax=Favolaschia claudopus TaxID=2862362 RepID=A0AAW0ECF8_9AGAR